MSRQDKLLDKLNQAVKTFRWSDLETLLNQLGYEQEEMAGSRVRFYHAERKVLIRLHKPHPENEIKGGALKAVKQHLKQEGFL